MIMKGLNHIVLVSKDATLPEYFGVYGGKILRTPNIDELAAKGTIFNRHYTAAPSTAMAFAAMFTGKFSYEMGYTNYQEVEKYAGRTLFDELEDRGYENHILWSHNYIKMAERYSKCYGKNTVHHDTMSFNLSCGINTEHSSKFREYDSELMESVVVKILKEVDSIDYKNKPIFLWIHMPHCMLGGISYGSDMEYFDKLIGELRNRFGDDNFFITADHGHMNGVKGKYAYGFDVYEKAIRIPLVAPLISGQKTIDFPTSNIQLSEIILNHSVTKLPYVLSDTAYCAQPHRKLAIIKDDFCYIYNRRGKKEELYNILIDPTENINLVDGFFRKDPDRKRITDIRQVVLSQDWENVSKIFNDLRSIKDSIWKTGVLKEELRLLFSYYYKRMKFGLLTCLFKSKKLK